MRQVHSENSFSYDSWVMIQLPHLMLTESLKITLQVAFNKQRKLYHFYVSREAVVARRNLDGVHSWRQRSVAEVENMTLRQFMVNSIHRKSFIQIGSRPLNQGWSSNEFLAHKMVVIVIRIVRCCDLLMMVMISQGLQEKTTLCLFAWKIYYQFI